MFGRLEPERTLACCLAGCLSNNVPLGSLNPSSAAGRTGRPPLHPGTVDRSRQRKLSFGAASFDAAMAVAAGRTPRAAARPAKAASPLDRLEVVVERQAGTEKSQQEAATQPPQQLESDPQPTAAKPPPPQDAPWDVEAVSAQLHSRQRSLAAVLSPADLQFGFSLPSQEEAAAERAAEEARLLASMPRELRRYSTDGIVSFDTLKVGGGV